MSATVWVIGISLIALFIAALGIVFLWNVRKKGRHEADYRAFFYMGLVWMIVGAGLMFLRGNGFNGLFAMGVIFFALGAAKKDRWKNSKPLTRNQKVSWCAVTAFLIILIVAIYMFLP